MPEFRDVCRVGDLSDGEARTVELDGKLIALFCQGNEYFAIDDTCPHMGASLGAGEVYDGVVACPWHAWRFKVCDGTWCDSPKIKIDSFEVRTSGDDG